MTAPVTHTVQQSPRRLLANIGNGLLEGRDIEEQRARVAELEGLVERLRP